MRTTLTLATFLTMILAAAAIGRADDKRQQGGKVELKQTPSTVEVSIDGKPFTVYHYAATEGMKDAKEGKPVPYVRPYFFPVLAADGTPVTSDQLTQGGDHPHHRSLYVAHGDVNGAQHWEWHGEQSPKQKHLKFDKVEGGDAGTIVQQLEWESKDRKPMLRETRTLRFFGYDDGSRGIDMTVQLTPAEGAGPVTFADTKEAGLCSVRVAKAISDKPTLTNSRGQRGEKQAWGKPAEWCDLSGEIDGKPYGVAIFDHPANPRHPSRWHARDYGLMTANVFGLSSFDKAPAGTGDFTIEPGKTATFHYRVVVHPGDAAAAKLDEKYKQFAAEAAPAAAAR